MTPLGEVPGEITDATDRAPLVDEWMRLKARRDSLQRIGEIFEGECQRVERGTSQWQSCNSQINRLTQDRLSYNADVKAFRSRITAAVISSRRPSVSDPLRVEGGTRDALNAANRKTTLLLDALEAGAGNWQVSLRFLEDHVPANPDDRATRDALEYLRGMYKGHLAASDMSNRYYKYGVRRWLDGDYLAASRALAQAARDDPDDLKLYRSWAYMVGRQHESPQCSAVDICAFDDLPKRASFFGPEHERALRSLKLATERHPEDLATRGLANVLDGMSVYAGLDIHPGAPLSREADALNRRARDMVYAGRYAAAADNFAEAYRLSGGDRAVLFLRHYFEGGVDAKRKGMMSAPQSLKNQMYLEMMAESVDWAVGILSGYEPPKAAAAAADVEASGGQDGVAGELYASLERALKAVNEKNPFFGVLPAAAVAGINDTGGTDP